jgi:hypothetical protein
LHFCFELAEKLGVADPRAIYNEDAELLALWGGYYALKNTQETSDTQSNPPLDLDQHVAMCDRLLG